MRFTEYKFENEDVHFLDTKIINYGEIKIYAKYATSSLYVDYNSHEPYQTKTACIRVLYERAHEIYSNDKQVASIKKVMPCNEYPYFVSK